jgi:protein-tyrosine-phosphatase
MTTKVLFLCPHSAGKSVLAATYFRAATRRLGVDAEASVAGTEPDREVMPNVSAALAAQGFVESWQPRLVTAAEIDAADVIVNIGCVHADLPTDRRVTDWDVPLLSENFVGSMAALHERAESLARELA